MHRPLNIPPERLAMILCRREQRDVGQQLTLSYDRLRIMLERSEVTIGLAGKYVDTYAFADGGLEVRWQGLSLPYKAFSKDQRVSHAAIVENKRLGEVLAFIKSQQDARPSVRVKTNSEKTGYQKTGRKPPGKPRLVDKRWPSGGPRDPLDPALNTIRPTLLLCTPRTLHLGCNISGRRKARVSPLSKAGISVSPVRQSAGRRAWLVDDDRTRPAAGPGAGRGGQQTAHHRLGGGGAGTEHPADAPA